MGTITRHSSGMLRAQVSLGFVAGRRQRPTRYFHDEAEAAAWIDEVMGRFKTGKREPASQRLGDFLVAWITRETPKIAPMTATNYRTIIGSLPPELAGLPIGKVEPPDVQAWVDSLGGSPRTVAWKRNMLRSALNDAVRLGLVERNAAAFAKPPRQRRPRRKVVTAADCAAIIAATKKWRYHAAVAVSIGTGVRQGELLGLAWADVKTDRILVRRRLRRQDGEYVVVDGTKADSEVIEVPLPTFARRALDEWRRTQDEERRKAGVPDTFDRSASPVFTTERGLPVNGSWLTHRFQKTLEAAGLTGFDWKDMRTATAELLAAAKVEQTAARDYLRHASYATTADHYTGSSWDVLAAAGAAIDAAVGS